MFLEEFNVIKSRKNRCVTLLLLLSSIYIGYKTQVPLTQSFAHSSLHFKNYKTYELDVWKSGSSNNLDVQ